MYISYYMRRDLKRLGLVLLLIAAAVWVWFQLNERMLPALARAEALCEEKPALTRATLDSIPPRWWWHPERRARHSLFYSKALDRELVDITSDSLILPAVEYYSLRGPDHYAMLSYYYAGRVEQNSGRTARAYAYFTFADRLADSLGDYHTGGLIARGLAEIHNYTNDFASELRYAQKAYDLFTRAGSSLHADWACYDLANAQANNKEYEAAIDHYEHFFRAALLRADTLAASYALTDMSASYLSLNRGPEAKALLERSHREYGYPINAKWLSDYACACARSGDGQKALRTIAQAEQLITDASSRMRVWGRKAQIYAACGNYDSAYTVEQELARMVDSAVRISLEQSVVSHHRDFYRHETDRLTTRLSHRTRLLLGVILILMGLSVAVVAGLMHRNRMRRREIEEYMAQIELFRCDLMKRETALVESGTETMQQFKERFSLVNTLAETYYTHQNSPVEQQKIYSLILENLREFGSKGYVERELLPIINRTHNRVIERMKSQLDPLKESEVQLICYLLTGFSTSTIALFLNTSAENIYRRTYRLRERIRNSSAPDREEFLEVLR